MRSNVLAVVVLLVMAAGPVGLAGQTEEGQTPSHRGVWLDVGVGSLASERDDGTGFFLQLTRQRGSEMFGARFISATDALEGGSDGSIIEVGPVYGRAMTGSLGRAAVAAGVSYVSMPDCGDGSRCGTVGIPVLAEVALHVVAVGVGVQGFGNFNLEASHGGMAFFLRFGWLP